MALIGVLGIGVPIWAVTVLPLTIAWQLVETIRGRGRESETTRAARKTLEEAAKDDFVVSKDEFIDPKERSYDLILIGATGFTGRLAMRHLIQYYHDSTKEGSKEKVRWAIAGRSKDKLEKIKKEVIQDLYDEGVLKTSQSVDIDVFVIDTLLRDESLHNLIRNTRCVASTAGPFALYGSHIVEFCAKYGTHYVDITGEQGWSRQMIHKWQTTAKSTGAKIVSFCGHDCIPWDLTVYKMKQKLSQQDEDLTSIVCLNESQGQSISGGTLATIMMGVDGYTTPKFKEGDPWLRVPDDDDASEQKSSSTKPKYEISIPFMPQKVNVALTNFASQSLYTSFHAMAPLNAQIVRRSHVLLEHKKKSPSKLVYNEGVLELDYPTALLSTVSLVLAGSFLLNPLTRYLVENYLLPPGNGPSKKARDASHMCVYAVGTGSKGSQVESAMYFPKDVGYAETSRMLAESGLCLSLNDKELVAGGGFFTPSAAMGDVLFERLCQGGTMYRCAVK
eukprot:CAMPEP_0197823818 /NCGR_PEP_ID=MMETSP1437-20131217/1128_1 /TAXON_ID=49252 ORGANISM="Eucampia antarctica, Strain CCMP1452" /NCGR_SAMPLE_ID=MMETSP1437 /ASSEMBLY_ACC=CAM_ASM_001096 /LENGTH=503 /DNA_ID=CAMNT_0043423171 /DNA_START=357 /DNA_END=1868 /DNA_ORIENTATION=+